MDDILAFDSVIRTGSISHAAQALGITQSAVTRRVQTLEETLGVTLLNRETRPSRPTQIGRRVHEQVRLALEQLEQITNVVEEDAEPEGIFRLGVPQFLSEGIAIGAIASLKEEFPRLDIQVTTATTPALLSGLLSGDIDTAALVMSRQGSLPEALVGHRLSPLSMTVVGQKFATAPADYRLDELHSRGWILNPGECGFRNGLNNALNAQGLPLKLNLDVAGVEVQLGLVAAGHGLALVPAHMLETSRHRDAVAPLVVTDFRLDNDLWLAHPRILGRLTQAATAFGAYIRDAMAPVDAQKRAPAPELSLQMPDTLALQ